MVVDAPFASDLVPTLLHETFHSTAFNVTDAGLSVATTGSAIVPSPGASQAEINAVGVANSRAASAQFNKHCTPKT